MLSNVLFFLEVANLDEATIALQNCEVVILLSSKDQLSEVFTKDFRLLLRLLDDSCVILSRQAIKGKSID